MFVMAGKLGMRISEIEKWPLTELLEWADYEKIRETKLDQSPESMMRQARVITSQMKGRSRG